MTLYQHSGLGDLAVKNLAAENLGLNNLAVKDLAAESPGIRYLLANVFSLTVCFIFTCIYLLPAKFLQKIICFGLHVTTALVLLHIFTMT